MSHNQTSNMNIVTTLCVDPNDTSFNYQLYYLNNKKKRETYWKCCVTFFGTSLRFNPGANHILFTNDKEEIIIDNVDIKNFLKNLGVKIVELPFEKFNPPKKFSTYHILTLYNLDVIHALGKAEDATLNVFLDSDCIWVNPYPDTSHFNADNNLIVYDMYNLSDPLKKIHGITRKDIGLFYKKFDPDYPVEYPVWYGGEFVAGNSKVFKSLSEELEYYFELIIHNPDKSPKLPNKMKIFDGDELILSLVYNKLPNKKVDAGDIIKRIWTNPKTNQNNINNDDIFGLSIWHMIGEKLFGIPLLCDKILDLDSEFWSIDTDELSKYLGLFFGFPKREFMPQIENKYKTLMPKIANKFREMINNIRT